MLTLSIANEMKHGFIIDNTLEENTEYFISIYKVSFCVRSIEPN